MSDETKKTAEDPNSKPADSESSADSPNNEYQQEAFPKINFSTFIFSLNSSALVHLGAVEDPASGKKDKNLVMAKQTIDILGMLEEKTRGNLNVDEEGMLKHILTDLRLRYVREQ